MKRLFFILFASLIAFSCSKEGNSEVQEPDPQEVDFDINNPIGFYAAIQSNENVLASPYLYRFLPDNMIQPIYIDGYGEEVSYQISGNNTVVIPGRDVSFTIENNEIKEVSINGIDDVEGRFFLIKNPENNVLKGNTYTGIYFKENGDVLHPNFFYSFHEDFQEVDAGLEVGTTLRTENYQTIGNFGALTSFESTDANGEITYDNEMMIWVEDRLEVNYLTTDVLSNIKGQFNGSFTKL